MQVEILVPLSFFALVFGSIYIFVTTRNKERLALIEKGASPELFKSKPDGNSNYRTFKLGLFLIGIALGILCGYFLVEGGMNEEPAYFSMIFLFGGIALAVSYFLQKKNPTNE
jgi:predicted MFS family arabinose efflux permease